MLPGKKYSPEDVLAVLRKRIWWILVPLSVASAGSAVYARWQPDLYRSRTLVLVVPQQVPNSYVRNTVTTQIQERLNAITQQILSRTRLEAIVQEFNLYPEKRETEVMEDIVAQMRLDIRVQPERGDAFSISYVGREPRTVMRVTERLASHFIDESLKDRQLLADGTNEFLESQLVDARQRLLAHEKKLEDYKRRYAGQLPTQVEANLRSMQAVQAQIQSILDQISRDQERRLMAERELADRELQGEEPTGTQSTARIPESKGTPKSPLMEQLLAAQRELTAMELRGRKPDHPDHRRQVAAIKDLEARAAAEQAGIPAAAATTESLAPIVSGVELARRRRVAELRDEIKTIDDRIAEAREKESTLREAAAEYQRRAEAGPSRESELVELTRDYGTLQHLYTGLLANKYQAMIAANLEKRQIGERFRLLDPANLPQRPINTGREQIVLFGAMAGLGLGIAIIGLFEYRDRSFNTSEEVTGFLSLPVLAVVPFMRSERELRRIRYTRAIANVGLGTSVLVCLAVLAFALLS